MKEITVTADKQNIDEVFDFVEGELLAMEGMERKDLLMLHMIVDEIFSNIVSYAYEDNKGDVTVTFDSCPEDRTVSIRFTDTGKPFNPLEEEDPDVTLSAKERKPGGLGVFMVRNTVDDIHYERRDGKNILTITKKTGGKHV